MRKGVYKFWRYLLATAIVVLAGVGIWIWKSAADGDSGEQITPEPARMVDLRAVADLCGMEIYREETVLDTIHDKVLFGIWKLNGRILFDVEGIPAQLAVADTAAPGDTLRIRLPKERVELLESTAPDAWRVVDTYSLKLFGTDRLTPEEENLVKRRALERTRRGLYKDGTVERARREASATLTRMLTPVAGRPVAVDIAKK